MDFIQNHTNTASSQPRVALYPTVELGLDIGATVVKNGSWLRNIQLA